MPHTHIRGIKQKAQVKTQLKLAKLSDHKLQEINRE